MKCFRKANIFQDDTSDIVVCLQESMNTEDEADEYFQNKAAEMPVCVEDAIECGMWNI